MKTTTVLRVAISLSLLALLASCSPSTSNNGSSESYQNVNAEQSNIIGGETADVAYQQQNGVVGIFDVNKGALCTGSLIARNLVLTAAHCVNTFSAKAMIVFFAPDIKLVMGRTADGRIGFSKALARQAVQAIRNPKYNAKTDSMTESTNDIALILLASDAPVEFKLANLPPADLHLKAGDEVSMSGFGVSQFKADPETGEALVSKGSGLLRKVGGIKVQSILPSGEEVTFDQSQGRGACHGDSGGPAYFTDATTQTSYVVGVTSRGPGDCNEIAVYSSTQGQAQWIADTSASLLTPSALPAVPTAVATEPTVSPEVTAPTVSIPIVSASVVPSKIARRTKN